MTNISVLNKNSTIVHEWLTDISNNMGFGAEEQEKAFAILRYTLQELRDNLPLQNLAHFSAQLPTFIRGLLFEAWKPSTHSPKERRLEDFLVSIYLKLPNNMKDIDIEQAVRAVFATLQERIDLNEVNKLKTVLPKHIKDLIA